MRITCILLNRNNGENNLSFKKATNESTFIFDLDGTLADSAPLQKTAWQKTANKVAEDYSRPQILIDEYYNHGMSGNDNLWIMFDRLGLSDVPQEVKMRYRKIKTELYEGILQDSAREKGPDSLLVPGARNFLATIKRMLPDSKLIVASNALGAVPAINAAQLDSFFSKSHKPPTVIDGADKGILYNSSKPEPDIFLAAAKLQSANPKDCIVFEDSIEGIEAASKARMKYIIIGDLNPMQSNLRELLLGVFKNFNDIKIEKFISLVERIKI